MERNIRILKMISALIGFMPASAIWIIYFSKVSNSVIGGAIVFAVGMGVAALLDVPSGVFSDRVGRRAGAIIGVGSFVLCVAFYGLAQNWWMLLIGAIFDGLGIAMLSGNNQALLLESLRALKREDEFSVQVGKMMGWMHWLAAAAAFACAPLAAISMRLTVWAAVPGLVVAFVIAWFIEEPEHVRHAEPLTGHLRMALAGFRSSRRLVLLTVGSVLATGLGMATFMLRPVWSEVFWPIWAIGMARGVSALLAALGTWWGGAIVERFGALRSVVVSQALSSCADIAALMLGGVFSPAVLTSSSFAFGIGITGDAVMLQNEFSDEQRATMSSFVSLNSRLVFALASVGFGFVAASQSGITGALIVGELIMLGSVVMYLAAFRTSKKSKYSGIVVAS